MPTRLRCQATRVYSSMNASAATSCCGPSPATAASSARSDPSRARLDGRESPTAAMPRPAMHNPIEPVRNSRRRSFSESPTVTPAALASETAEPLTAHHRVR